MRKPTATSFLLLSTRWIMVLGPLLSAMPSKPNTCKGLSNAICTVSLKPRPPDALVPIIVQAYLTNALTSCVLGYAISTAAFFIFTAQITCKLLTPQDCQISEATNMHAKCSPASVSMRSGAIQGGGICSWLPSSPSVASQSQQIS
jgi:hypothetical protein